MGRKTTFEQSVADDIVERLSKGEPLTLICETEGYPTDRTVRRWAEADPQFASDIAGARESGHDAIAARARQTARGIGESSGDVQRDKLIIDTDLKLLAKWDKRYGERTQHEHTGANGGAIEVAVKFV